MSWLLMLRESLADAIKDLKSAASAMIDIAPEELLSTVVRPSRSKSLADSDGLVP